MTWGSNKLHFTYDSIGPASVTYNGTTYLYVKNAQGDVVQIVDGNGNTVVTYIYDAWGNMLYSQVLLLMLWGNCYEESMFVNADYYDPIINVLLIR